MNIHQMQVRYDPRADRVLWQLRTAKGELFAVWLTRRMLRQVWPMLQQLVTQSGLRQMAPNATLLPEARDMLAQAARERVLPTAQFGQPFDDQATAQPLGAEPLLPEAVDMGPGAQGGLNLRVREGNGRSLTLQLGDDLATGLLRLIEQALLQADWGVVAGPEAAVPAPAAPRGALN